MHIPSLSFRAVAAGCGSSADEQSKRSEKDARFHIDRAQELADNARFDLAEEHLLEGYRLCRTAGLLRLSADIAERMSILLHQYSSDAATVNKARAWHKLAISLQTQIL